MKILIGCEESQEVCKAFRAKGHEAYSCDILPCSGGHPEWHIKGDILECLNGTNNNFGQFWTEDGMPNPNIYKWDMVIAFPPCTDLACSGAAWFAKKVADGRQQAAIDFFMLFANADCGKVVIENPVGIMSSKWRKPDQIINPWEFGDPFEKKTCLWVKGVPLLMSTNIVKPPKRTEFASGKSMPTWYADAWRLPKAERAKLRSKTFPGIAKAMANQWG
jgi:site-specific DNA-cytosine methylase